MPVFDDLNFVINAGVTIGIRVVPEAPRPVW